MSSSAVARGSNDIVFTLPDGTKLKCHIYRDKSHGIAVNRIAAPVEEGQQPRYRETSKTWRDWRRGAGFEIEDDESVGGYAYGSFVDAERRGLLGPAGFVEEMPLPPGTVTRFNRSFEIDGSIWYTCLNDRMLKVPSLVDDPVDAGVSMGTDAVTQDVALFKDKAWIANGQNSRIYSFNGSNWAPATDDVRYTRVTSTNWVLGSSMAGAGMSAGVPYPVFLGAGDGGLYHCTDDPGTLGDRVGPNVIGNLQIYGVQKLFATSEAAFASGPGGVTMIQGGGRMPNLTPWWLTEYDPSNGATAEFYDAEIFAGTVQTWERVSPDTSNLGQMEDCAPGASESFESSPVFGRATASTQFDGKMVVSFYNGAKSYVMFGKRAERLNMRNRNTIVWYGPYFECNGAIRDIRLVSPLNTAYPRFIYYATDDQSGVPHLFRQDYPREKSAYASTKRSRTWRAYPNWSASMSACDLGDPDAPKIMRFYGCVAEGLSDTNSVTIVTNTDVSDDDVSQATLVQSPRDYAVADTATAMGHLVRVRADVINDPANPVFIRAIKARGTVNDEKTTLLTVPIILGRGVKGQNGQTELRDMRVNATLLYEMLVLGPIEWEDWLGRAATIVLEDIKEQEIEDADHKGVTRIANLTISVLLTQEGYGTMRFGAGKYS